MAITNAFEITYGTQAVGGTSQTYLLDGPYGIDKSHDELRVTFQVQVVGESFESLQTLSDALETAFRTRDQSFTISIDGNDWVYTFGENVLKTQAAAVKVASKDTDRGFGRGYICTISAELPSDDTDGLRDLNVLVSYEPGRRKQVAMRGTYTALEGTSASAQYAAEFPAEATAILTGIDATATWELVSEQIDRDRLDHLAQFARQYTELLANQSIGVLDDTQIRDHRLTFARQASYPGDTPANLIRLQRVTAQMECWADVDVTTDLAALEVKVREYIKVSFVEGFNPIQYGVEDSRFNFDQTSKRLTAAMQFIYHPQGGQETIEAHHSVLYREQNITDYTPVHNGDRLAAYADDGWTIRERTFTRTLMLIGEAGPGDRPSWQPPASWGSASGGASLTAGATGSSGWRTTQSTSQSAPLWVGDPQMGPQIQVTAIQDTSTQRYSKAPAVGGGGSSNQSGFPIFTIPLN